MRRDRTTEPPLVVYGANPVRELLASDVPVERLYLGRGAQESALVAAARTRGIAPTTADRATLDRVAGSPHHQGAVAIGPPFPYASLAALLTPACASALVLDEVQDPRNLGAILRTARAAGVGGVVMARDRSVGVTAVVAAASAGLLFGLPIARVTNLVRAMGEMKEGGFWLIGLVPAGGTPLSAFDPPPRPALVVGGEGTGVRELVRRTCDFIVTIPMAPGVESLNVAVASGIALYEILLRRRSP